MALTPAGEQYKAAANQKVTGWAEAARLMRDRGDSWDDAYAKLCGVLEMLVEPEQAIPLLGLALMHLADPPLGVGDLAHLDFDPRS